MVRCVLAGLLQEDDVDLSAHMRTLSHALDGHNPTQPLRSTSPPSSPLPSSGAAAYVNKVIPLETTFTLRCVSLAQPLSLPLPNSLAYLGLYSAASVGVAFFIYAKLLLAELRLHSAAAQKDSFSAAQYFNPGALGCRTLSRACLSFKFSHASLLSFI